MKPYTIFLAAACAGFLLLACSDSPNPETSTIPEMRIHFESPGVFLLGEVKHVDYAISGREPSSISPQNVPAGWEVLVDRENQRFIVKCEQTVPDDNRTVSVSIQLKTEDGAVVTASWLDLHTEGGSITDFSDTIVAASEWSVGEGTEDSPWEIWTLGELKLLANTVNGPDPDNLADKYYRLMIDIKVTASEWTPIGIDTYFNGNFDGNGMTVSGELTGDSQFFGFFGAIGNNAVVSNLTVEADITNNYSGQSISYTGAIAGYADGAYIYANPVVTACTVRGNVRCYAASRTSYTGGIVGHGVGRGEVSSCDFTGNIEVHPHEGISLDEIYVGGIAGAHAGDIIGCRVQNSRITATNPPRNRLSRRNSGLRSPLFKECHR